MTPDNCLPKDCRQTKIRHAIMGIFIHHQKPQTAAEILEIIKKHTSSTVNKTTVYRQLEFLQSKQLINVIEIDGIKRYQLSTNSPKKIFFCSSCHQFVKVKSEDFLDQKQLNQISLDNKFKINHYLTTFFGTCQKCQPAE
jgi:Fe2+ or Zn2+ uptake regulation protein